MKRKLIVFVFSALCVIAPITAFASEGADLPSLDTDNGIYELLGCDFFTYNDESAIIVFGRYENTTDENTSPIWEYNVKAFQDGVKLDGFYYMSQYDATGTEWADARDSMTEIQPGGSIVYYQAFTLESDSDIDVEISDFWEDNVVSYTFKCGDSVVSSVDDSGDVSNGDSEDYEAMYYELLEQYEQLQADYDALVNEG